MILKYFSFVYWQRFSCLCILWTPPSCSRSTVNAKKYFPPIIYSSNANLAVRPIKATCKRKQEAADNLPQPPCLPDRNAPNLSHGHDNIDTSDPEGEGMITMSPHMHDAGVSALMVHQGNKDLQ
jgi:hypothetical protein